MRVTISCPHCGGSQSISLWPGVAVGPERTEVCSSCGAEINLLAAVTEALSRGETSDSTLEEKSMAEQEKTPEQRKPPLAMFALIDGVCQGCGKEATLRPMISPINEVTALYFCTDCYEEICDKYPG